MDSAKPNGATYVAIYQVECAVCAGSPVVGIHTPSGQIASTGLCGVHFWGDRTMLDPDEWNEEKESTE